MLKRGMKRGETVKRGPKLLCISFRFAAVIFHPKYNLFHSFFRFVMFCQAHQTSFINVISEGHANSNQSTVRIIKRKHHARINCVQFNYESNKFSIEKFHTFPSIIKNLGIFFPASNTVFFSSSLATSRVNNFADNSMTTHSNSRHSAIIPNKN